MRLEALKRHFYTLYGPRNRVFLDSWRKRIDFLNLSIVDLSRGLRRQITPDQQTLGVVRIASRVFCVAEYFDDYMQFIDVLCRKYSSVCPYCFQPQCECGPNRPNAQLATVTSVDQLGWSLTEWCSHFGQLYGNANAKRSIEGLLLRLHEEAIEGSSLAMSAPSSNDSATTIIARVADELSDTLGWLIAIANALGVDLESGLLERYYPNCWKCHHHPCECGAFNHQQIDWARLA